MLFSKIFGKKKVAAPVTVEVEMFSSEVSKVRCFENDCYFNRSIYGEACCDLKSVEIFKGGKCGNFKPRPEAAAFFKS